MADGPVKNLQVLKEQAVLAAEMGKYDLVNARKKWKDGDYLGAIKTAVLGPIAEWYQHAWRWQFYRDGLILLLGIWGYFRYIH